MILLLFEHPTGRIICEVRAVYDFCHNAGDKDRDSDRRRAAPHEPRSNSAQSGEGS
jgi:hypothetical protein